MLRARFTRLLLTLGTAILGVFSRHATVADRPNIVFITSDDHATHAIGAYGSKVNTALVGKWHLGSDPMGVDHWEAPPGQHQ